MQITRTQAEHITDLLIEKASAADRDNDDERNHIITLIMRGHGELRICHAFGFGGKLYNCCGEFSVGTYRETLTPEIAKVIDEVNADLAEIMREAA